MNPTAAGRAAKAPVPPEDVDLIAWIISTYGDDLDEQERAALHRSIDESIEEERAGNLEDLSKIIAELRAQL